MADYPAQQSQFLDDQLESGVGRLSITGYQGGTAQWNAPTPEKTIEAIAWDSPAAGVWARNLAPAPVTPRNFASRELPTGPETDWFDHVYVLPRSISAGIVLATKVFTITIYSSYKTEQRSLDDYINNAGDGLTIPDLPTLPETIETQSGFDVTLNVLPEGPPTISGTLDFEFDTLTVELPITGQRTIIFAHEPESPLVETLIWQSDVRRGSDGKEQRAALRHTPRAEWNLTYQTEGDERRTLENKLIDSQARIFGIPHWPYPAILQSPIAVDDTVITVDSTAYSSFIDDGLAIVFRTYADNEALQISSFTGTTITFATPFTQTFTAGARVLPLRLGLLRATSQRGRRWPLNLQEHQLVFTSVDNDADLSDTSAFPSYNSKVFLTDPNMIRDTLAESQDRQLFVLDSGTGIFNVYSEWPISRRTHAKTFFTGTRQALWETRQLLHALRGRVVSFYIPTFYPDVIAVQNIGSGNNTVNVQNFGYTTFIQSRQPRNVIRLVKTDGTTVTRTIVSSTEIDDTEEQFTLDTTWGVDATLAEIDRIEFVEKVRFDSDRIAIKHLDAIGQAEIRASLIDVLD